MSSRSSSFSRDDEGGIELVDGEHEERGDEVSKEGFDSFSIRRRESSGCSIEVGEDEFERVLEAVEVVDLVRVLVLGFGSEGRIDESVSSLDLFLAKSFDLGDERLGRDGLLVVGLEGDSLMIERLVEVLGVDLPPDLVPLPLSSLPLLVLLLESSENNRNGDGRVLVKSSDDLESRVSSVDLLDDPLVDGLGLSSESRLESEDELLLGGHESDSSGDGFEESDRSEVGFDVVVVLVSFLLGSMERFLVDVLLVSDEGSRVLGGGGRMRDPFVVENVPAHRIPTRAREVDLL